MADSLPTDPSIECYLDIDNELIECSNKCVEYLKKVDEQLKDKEEDKISYIDYMIKIDNNSILSIEGIYKYEPYIREMDGSRYKIDTDFTTIDKYKDCLLKRLRCKTMAD